MSPVELIKQYTSGSDEEIMGGKAKFLNPFMTTFCGLLFCNNSFEIVYFLF